MIVVHGFAPMPPLASPSPYCLKLETWLRMAGLPYEARGDFNPMTAPRGKAPWVTLEDGSVLSDSGQIVAVLGARPEVTLDDGLSDEERARGVALRRLVENHLYFALLYARWIEDDGFAILRKAYFGGMDWPMRAVVPVLARRGVQKTAWYEGTGRLGSEEVVAGAVEDLDALAGLLGDRPFFLGEQARSVDATIWGLLANIHYGPFPGPLLDALRARPTLVAYCERVREAYWT